jgi:hypothetical protein
MSAAQWRFLVPLLGTRNALVVFVLTYFRRVVSHPVLKISISCSEHRRKTSIQGHPIPAMSCLSDGFSKLAEPKRIVAITAWHLDFAICVRSTKRQALN